MQYHETTSLNRSNHLRNHIAKCPTLVFTLETNEGKPLKYAMVKIPEQGKFYICDANGRIQFEGEPEVYQFTFEVSALNIRDTTMKIEGIPGKEHYAVTLQEEEFLLPEFQRCCSPHSIYGEGQEGEEIPFDETIHIIDKHACR